MTHARHSPESNRRYYEANKAKIALRRKQQRGIQPKVSVEDMTLEELIATQGDEPAWGIRSPIIGVLDRDGADPWDDPTFDEACGAVP